MAITINNGIANIDGTPGAISGVFSNRPSAANVAEGTLYFATDTAAIYQAVAGIWVNYAGGGGGTPGIDDVLAVGQIFSNDRVINADNFDFTIENIKIFQLKDTSTLAQFNFSQNQIEFFSNSLGFQTDNGNDLNIGDLSLVNGFVLRFDNSQQRLSIVRQTAYNGLDINFSSGVYQFGDYDNLAGNVSIGIESNIASRTLYVTDNLNVTGLELNFNNLQYRLGDLTALGLEVLVNLQTREITLKDNSLPNLFNLNFATQTATLYDFTLINLFNSVGGGLFVAGSASYLGDYDGTVNGSLFGIDDALQTLYATTNLLVGSSGSVSGQHLKINVAGTDYVIELKNP
jgi:hypothetical protein